MDERKIDIEKDDNATIPLLTIIEHPHEIDNDGETLGFRIEHKRPDLRIPLKDDLPSVLIPSETTSFNSAHLSNPNTPTASREVWRRRRSDRRLRRLNTELLQAIEGRNVKWAEVLISKGANPNATCRKAYVSACHMAAISGQDDALKLLLTKGAERNRIDFLGRTPLHLAIWGGHVKCVALLLDMPDHIVEGVDDKHMEDFENEGAKDKYKEFVNLKINSMETMFYLPDSWKDTIEHQCTDIEGTIPLMEEGWSPLHVAAAVCRPHCIHFLLAAGADPSVKDLKERTPLDVTGIAFRRTQYDSRTETADFLKVLQVLVRSQAPFNSMRKLGIDKIATPLHISVQISSLDGIKELIEYGAYPGTLDEDGETPLHLAVFNKEEEGLQLLLNTSTTDPFSQIVDVKNIKDDTILESSVREEWIPGVCLALENGADVAEQSDDGDTSLHAAASLGNKDILDEILTVMNDINIIDLKNHAQETALFKAVEAGSVDCVKALLGAGASVTNVYPGNVTILHKASEIGNKDVLAEILHVVEIMDKSMVNALTDESKKGFAPIHFATVGNHPECVKMLLESNANIRCRTRPKPHPEATALHLCAVSNLSEVAKVLIEFDTTIIHDVDGLGWFPIHTAAHFSSKDLIRILLKAGSDLSATYIDFKGTKKTAIDTLVHNMPRPTDYLEDLFDTYITTNTLSIEESACEVCVDFSILMPGKKEFDQMKVVTSLLNTGNRYKQKRLLLHPVIESFLYLKWQGLSPFFYGILAIFSFFVLTLTALVISLFYFSDNEIEVPLFFNTTVWTYLHFAATAFVVIEEFLYMSLNSTKYFSTSESWIKWSCVLLAAVLPFISHLNTSFQWPRHVATCAILLAWTELMFLISRCPVSGYYVLMFTKVAGNVMKILSLFLFLVVGFTISFMLQFFSKEPFDNPWSAFVKTMVMMTSEFEYSAIFDSEHTQHSGVTNYIVQIVFMLFLILASIVLMNLLIGVAVSDINDLEIQGNIHKLARQVDLLGTLDVLVHDRVFSRFMPEKISSKVRSKRNIGEKLFIYPARPAWKTGKLLPTRIKDAILLIATNNEDVDDSEVITCILKEVLELRDIVKKDSSENEQREKDAKQEDESKINKRSNELVEKLLNKLEDNESSLKRVENHLISLELKIDNLLNTK